MLYWYDQMSYGERAGLVCLVMLLGLGGGIGSILLMVRSVCKTYVLDLSSPSVVLSYLAKDKKWYLSIVRHKGSFGTGKEVVMNVKHSFLPMAVGKLIVGWIGNRCVVKGSPDGVSWKCQTDRLTFDWNKYDWMNAYSWTHNWGGIRADGSKIKDAAKILEEKESIKEKDKETEESTVSPFNTKKLPDGTIAVDFETKNKWKPITNWEKYWDASQNYRDYGPLNPYPNSYSNPYLNLITPYSCASIKQSEDRTHRVGHKNAAYAKAFGAKQEEANKLEAKDNKCS